MAPKAALAAVALAAAAGSAEGTLLPIFFMHGLNGYADWYLPMEIWIRAIDPDAVLYSFPIAERLGSLENLWNQTYSVIDALRSQVAARPDDYKDGYTLVCHSQGALVCRTVVQLMDDHNVHTLVALAGPQRGVFGLPDGLQPKLPWARDEVFHFAYTELLQDHLSIANLWHDPRNESWPFHPEQAYLTGNTFLPVVNNDPRRTSQGPGKAKDDGEAARYRRNFLRLRRAVFTCSPVDDQVLPYDSGIFNFYGPDPSQGTLPLESSPLWTEDWLGLRALHEDGRLVRNVVPDICHVCWARNATIFHEHVATYLPERGAEKGEPLFT